jgi:hypothetical protein
MFWEFESYQAPVQKPVSLIANLRREFVLGVKVNGGQEIIRPKNFFVNSFGAVDEI